MERILFTIGDQSYTKTDIENNRKVVKHLRDHALQTGDTTYAVALSHTLALLAKLIKLAEAAKDVEND